MASSDTGEGTVTDNRAYHNELERGQTVTITGADNLSDGDQSYAIRLMADTRVGLGYKYVDPM